MIIHIWPQRVPKTCIDGAPTTSKLPIRNISYASNVYPFQWKYPSTHCFAQSHLRSYFLTALNGITLDCVTTIADLSHFFPWNWANAYACLSELVITLQRMWILETHNSLFYIPGTFEWVRKAESCSTAVEKNNQKCWTTYVVELSTIRCNVLFRI